MQSQSDWTVSKYQDGKLYLIWTFSPVQSRVLKMVVTLSDWLSFWFSKFCFYYCVFVDDATPEPTCLPLILKLKTDTRGTMKLRFNTRYLFLELIIRGQLHTQNRPHRRILSAEIMVSMRRQKAETCEMGVICSYSVLLLRINYSV